MHCQSESAYGLSNVTVTRNLDKEILTLSQAKAIRATVTPGRAGSTAATRQTRPSSPATTRLLVARPNPAIGLLVNLIIVFNHGLWDVRTRFSAPTSPLRRPHHQME